MGKLPSAWRRPSWFNTYCPLCGRQTRYWTLDSPVVHCDEFKPESTCLAMFNLRVPGWRLLRAVPKGRKTSFRRGS